MASPKRQAGFSLLEGIAAMVLLAMVAAALYSWVATSTIGAQRAIAAKELVEVVRSAAAIMEEINPMENESGSFQISGHMVSWQATKLTAPAPVRANGAQPGFFDAALYQVEIKIFREEKLVGTYDTLLVGYVKQRNFEVF